MKKLAWLPLWVALIIGGAAVWDCAHAQATYNKFAPANGILKGSTTTYVTTPAVNTDVVSLFSGSCSASTYLSGSGVCSTPAGTGGGTVNSVAQTVPAGFAIAGSPITNTGTLAITYAPAQTASNFLATPTGTTGALGLRTIVAGDLPAISLTSGVSGILPLSNGGIGVGTLTGIAKGNGTSAFTVATSSDVIGLWSGTCSSTTFLRGDGACAAPSAVGTVTSVGLSWTGSGLTIANSPVTTSGTLAISGALAAGSGGSGEAGTLTGLLKGNAASAYTLAAAVDVYGLWSGTCSSTTFLRGDGACAAPSGATGANPSGAVGLTAVNGTATTFLRSDGAPALSQAISPTWSGTHTFSNAITVNGAGSSFKGGVTVTAPSSGFTITENVLAGVTYGHVLSGSASNSIFYEATNGTQNGVFGLGSTNILTIGSISGTEVDLVVGGSPAIVMSTSRSVSIPAPASGTALTVTAAANNNAAVINGANVTSQSFGAVVVAGTNSSDYNTLWQSATGTTIGRISGDGGFQVGSPTGADKGLGTINMQGCFVNNVPCLTSSATATKLSGGVITLGAGTCTVNNNSSNISGCSFSATGNVIVTFSSAYTSGTCVANSVDTSPVQVIGNQGTTIASAAEFIIRIAATSVLANGSFSFVCIGV